MNTGIPQATQSPGRPADGKIRPSAPQFSPDELLIQYLSASDESIAQDTLAQLMQEAVLPRIRRVVAGRLSQWNSESHEIDDVCGDAVVVLLGRLRAMRDSREGEIGSIGGYAAAVASQMVADYLRRKYPLRHQLQNRIRYALNHTPGLAAWTGTQGELLCGREHWPRVGSAARLQEQVDRWPGVYAQILPDAAHSPLAVVIQGILDYLDGPVELDGVVSMAARALRILDLTVELKPELHLADGSARDAVRNLDHRRWLGRLWKEILYLPVPQRVALLLHLRFDGNRPAVALFITTGIAGIRAIAEMLSIPIEEFAAMWGKLPLDDLAIAQRLGVTRQQVINLRQAGRKRLGRRLAAWGAEI